MHCRSTRPHGPGSPCGAGIVEREGVPTLGLERRSNPALQYDDQQEFIDHLLLSQPPIPYYWPRIKQINARGPEVLGSLPIPRSLKPKEFATLVSASTTQYQCVMNRRNRPKARTATQKANAENRVWDGKGDTAYSFLGVASPCPPPTVPGRVSSLRCCSTCCSSSLKIVSQTR